MDAETLAVIAIGVSILAVIMAFPSFRREVRDLIWPLKINWGTTLNPDKPTVLLIGTRVPCTVTIDNGSRHHRRFQPPFLSGIFRMGQSVELEMVSVTDGYNGRDPCDTLGSIFVAPGAQRDLVCLMVAKNPNPHLEFSFAMLEEDVGLHSSPKYKVVIRTPPGEDGHLGPAPGAQPGPPTTSGQGS